MKDWLSPNNLFETLHLMVTKDKIKTNLLYEYSYLPVYDNYTVKPVKIHMHLSKFITTHHLIRSLEETFIYYTLTIITRQILAFLCCFCSISLNGIASDPSRVHSQESVPFPVNEAPTGGSRFPSSKLILHRKKGHSVHR